MRIVMNMKEDGTFEFYSDQDCEIFVVCDHCPGDRVYRLTDAHTVGREFVDRELSDDPVGHSGDTRHAAIKHRILSSEAGEPYLKPVS